MLTKNAHKDQVPVTDARLRSLLNAAAAPAEPGMARGEEEALTAFRATPVRAGRRRKQMHTPRTLKVLGVAAASVSLLLGGGLAAANAGELPGAAQDTAREMLAQIGVEVPGADTRGGSGDSPAGGEDAADTDSQPDNHGREVSEVAKSTESEGRDKGEEIAGVASDGRAGVHGQSAEGGDDTTAPEAEGDGGQSGDHAPAVTPSEGGTGTGDDASSEHGATASTDGTGTAAERSGERSVAGSGNAP